MPLRRTSAATLVALLLALATATSTLAATTLNTIDTDIAGYVAGWSSKVLSVEATFTIPKNNTACPQHDSDYFGVSLGDPSVYLEPRIRVIIDRTEGYPSQLMISGYSRTTKLAPVSSKYKNLSMSPGDQVRLRVDYLPTLRKANIYAWNLTRSLSAMTDLYLPDDTYWNGARAFAGVLSRDYALVSSFGTVPVRNAKVFLANGGTYGFGDANTTSAKRIFMAGVTGRVLVSPSTFTSTTYFTLKQSACE